MGNDGEKKQTLFVGGISWNTESKDLKDYFGKFGAISRVYLKTDPNTGKHAGYGFVAFVSQDAVEEVIKTGPHTVKGKLVTANRAKARPGVKKIFVGGLASDIPEADIRTYFEKFGKIETIELPFDKVKKQRRQFCFITFEDADAVYEVCKVPKQKIGNKVCDIRKATLNPDPRSMSGGGAYGQSQGTSTQSFPGYNQGYGYVNFDDYGSSTAYGAGYGGWNYGQGGYGDGGYDQQQYSNGRIRRGGATTRAPVYHPYNF